MLNMIMQCKTIVCMWHGMVKPWIFAECHGRRLVHPTDFFSNIPMGICTASSVARQLLYST